MSIHTLILFPLITAVLGAGELPWIGVSLGSPTTAERNEVDLSEGVGLKVNKVVTASPLANAGGQARDLWWKLDGQILINKRQMLVLLRTKSPGDRVKIDYYRDRKLKSLSLVLSSREQQQVYTIGTHTRSADTSRILAKREQIARLSAGKQKLSLQREGENWRFKVLEEETTILSSLVTDIDLNEKVPTKWHGSFLILKLTLEQQVSSASQANERRIRYVPREKSSEE